MGTYGWSRGAAVVLTTALSVAVSVAGSVAGSAGVAAGAPAPGRAATCARAGSPVEGDVDGDGRADVAVGAKYSDTEVGRVELALADGRRQVVGRRDVPPALTGDFSGFGTALALTDVTGDGCSDLLVTAPDDNAVEPDDDDSGGGDPGRPPVPRLFVLPGDPAGVDPARATSVVLPGQGYTLAVLRNTDAAGRPQVQVAVGLPTAPRGGAVAVYLVDDRGRLGRPTVLTQDSPGISGVGEADDFWGSALAATGRTLVVGAPLETVGRVSRAGSVTMLTSTAAAPQSFTGRAYSQASAGVPGTAQAEDELGDAVAAFGSTIAVGVPGDWSGGREKAGAVNLFSWNEKTRTLTPRERIHQGTPGIPGSNETYDRFGGAVAVGRGIQTAGRDTLVVGSQNENVGDTLYAGSWTMLDLGTTHAVKYDQGSPGVPGTPVDRRGAGLRLAVVPGTGPAATRRDNLAVGLPVVGVGSVLVGPRWPSAGWTRITARQPGTYDDFGDSLAG